MNESDPLELLNKVLDDYRAIGRVESCERQINDTAETRKFMAAFQSAQLPKFSIPVPHDSLSDDKFPHQFRNAVEYNQRLSLIRDEYEKASTQIQCFYTNEYDYRIALHAKVAIPSRVLVTDLENSILTEMQSKLTLLQSQTVAAIDDLVREFRTLEATTEGMEWEWDEFEVNEAL